MTEVKVLNKKDLFIEISLRIIEEENGTGRKIWAKRMSKRLGMDIFPIIYLLEKIIDSNQVKVMLPTEKISRYLFSIENEKDAQDMLQILNVPFRILRIYMMFMHEIIMYATCDDGCPTI